MNDPNTENRGAENWTTAEGSCAHVEHHLARHRSSGIVDRGAFLWRVIAYAAVLSACGSAPPPAPSGVEKLNGDGVERLERGDSAGAEDLFHEALAEAELVDDLEGEGAAWSNLAGLALDRGRGAEARAAYARALVCYGDLRARAPGEIKTRASFGVALLDGGDPTQAQEQLDAAVTLANAFKRPELALSARASLALLLLRRGDAPRASALAAQVALAAERAGDDAAFGAALLVDAMAREATNDIAGGRGRAEAALDVDRKRGAARAVIEDLHLLGRLSERANDRIRAASYWGRSARALERLGQIDAALVDWNRALVAANGTSRADAIARERDRLKTPPKAPAP